FSLPPLFLLPLSALVPSCPSSSSSSSSSPSPPPSSTDGADGEALDVSSKPLQLEDELVVEPAVAAKFSDLLGKFWTRACDLLLSAHKVAKCSIELSNHHS